MKRIAAIGSWLGLLIVGALSARAQPSRLPGGPPPVMPVAVAAACPGCAVGAVERRVLAGNVVEYSFDLRVGGGEHEIVRLHRVVAEVRPGHPARQAHALFMIHGDIWGFDAAFLNAVASPAVPDAHALPIFLAAQGIDVWGMDFRWVGVSAATADLGFMAGWDLTTDARDTRLAMGLARLVRAASGAGGGPFPLLGWSRGGQIGYAVLGAESQLPRPLRNASGFVAVETFVKTDQPDLVAAACLRLAITQAQQAAGETAATSGGLLATLGQLAALAGAEPSPIVPGLSNLQVGWLTGSATFQFLPPGGAFAPYYHFAGGTFDALGLPTGLTYQSDAGFFDFLAGAAPLQPLAELVEGDAAACDDPAAPAPSFADHLGDIRVPVLYVGAGGGVGDFGTYTTTLLASRDVSTLVVSLEPPERRLLDLGHADVFQAAAAPGLFWQPILDWLLVH